MASPETLFAMPERRSSAEITEANVQERLNLTMTQLDNLVETALEQAGVTIEVTGVDDSHASRRPYFFESRPTGFGSPNSASSVRNSAELN